MFGVLSLSCFSRSYMCCACVESSESTWKNMKWLSYDIDMSDATKYVVFLKLEIPRDDVIVVECFEV